MAKTGGPSRGAKPRWIMTGGRRERSCRLRRLSHRTVSWVTRVTLTLTRTHTRTPTSPTLRHGVDPGPPIRHAAPTRLTREDAERQAARRKRLPLRKLRVTRRPLSRIPLSTLALRLPQKDILIRSRTTLTDLPRPVTLGPIKRLIIPDTLRRIRNPTFRLIPPPPSPTLPIKLIRLSYQSRTRNLTRVRGRRRRIPLRSRLRPELLQVRRNRLPKPSSEDLIRTRLPTRRQQQLPRPRTVLPRPRTHSRRTRLCNHLTRLIPRGTLTREVLPHRDTLTTCINRCSIRPSRVRDRQPRRSVDRRRALPRTARAVQRRLRSQVRRTRNTRALQIRTVE